MLNSADLKIVEQAFSLVSTSYDQEVLEKMSKHLFKLRPEEYHKWCREILAFASFDKDQNRNDAILTFSM